MVLLPSWIGYLVWFSNSNWIFGMVWKQQFILDGTLYPSLPSKTNVNGALAAKKDLQKDAEVIFRLFEDFLLWSFPSLPYIQDLCYTGSFIYLGDTLLNLIPNTLRHCAENFKSLPHLSCNGLSYTRWIVTSFRKVYFEKNANLKLHRYSHFRKKLHWWSESLLWRKWKIVKFCWCLSCHPMNCYILQTSLLWEKWKLKVTPLQPFQKKVYFEEVKVKNCELLLVFVLHPMNCYILQKSLLWEKWKLTVTLLQQFQ